MLCNQRKIGLNIIAEIAARRAPHRHILCKAVAVAVADEFARDARVYAVVDHCAADTKSCWPRPVFCVWRYWRPNTRVSMPYKVSITVIPWFTNCRLRPGLWVWRRLTSKHKDEHAQSITVIPWFTNIVCAWRSCKWRIMNIPRNRRECWRQAAHPNS